MNEAWRWVTGNILKWIPRYLTNRILNSFGKVVESSSLSFVVSFRPPSSFGIFGVRISFSSSLSRVRQENFHKMGSLRCDSDICGAAEKWKKFIWWQFEANYLWSSIQRPRLSIQSIKGSNNISSLKPHQFENEISLSDSPIIADSSRLYELLSIYKFSILIFIATL